MNAVDVLGHAAGSERVCAVWRLDFVDGVRSRFYCLLSNYIFWEAQKFAIFTPHARLFSQ